MNAFLSHKSALELYNVPSLDVIFAGISRFDMQPGAKDYTFPEPSVRSQASAVRSHRSRLPLPKGAVVEYRGTPVASPEFTFVQLAKSLDIHRMVLLGMEMCSHANGMPERALTSKRRIEEFLPSAAGHSGCRAAMRAVKYIADGSGSIMESLIFMLLTLPHALGGYGLDGAVCNRVIALDKESRKIVARSRYFADFFYEEKPLAVEYDSNEYHSTQDQRSKDMIRASVLERMGVQVVSFNTAQLYDWDKFSVVAHNVAARLGRRIVIRTTRFAPMQARIRNLLPTMPPNADKAAEH